MLKKYQSFIKLSKTSECAFYQAIIRENNQKVIIKRIKQECSWSQMLSCPSLKLQSKQYYFPKLIQIFKTKGSYFIVYEKPNGYNLNFQNQIQRKQIQQFYEIFSQILKSVNDLKQQIKDLYIYPQWIFTHRNSIKICHFEPYFIKKQQNIKSKDEAHVFMYNIQNKQFSLQQHKKQSTEFQRIQNINFNLGYIAYHLLTGQITQWQDDQQKYFKSIKQIQSKCRNKIIQQTKDQKLANLIDKLIKFEDIDSIHQSSNELFTEFHQFVKNKNKYLVKQRSNTQSHRIVQVTMQKMSLFTKSSIIRNQKKKKSVRPCCINKTFQELNNQEQSPQDNQYKLIDKHKLAAQRRRSFKRHNTQHRDNPLHTHNHTNLHNHNHNNHSHTKSPTISQKKLKSNEQTQNKSHLNRHKINLSCFLPSLSTQRKISGIINNLNALKPNSKKTMFRSQEKT